MKQITQILTHSARCLRPAFVAGALLAVVAGAALAAEPAPETKPVIDPRADELLKRMGDYLAQAPFYSVNAEIWQDVQTASGQRLQAGRTVELQLRRPDHFHTQVHSTRRERELFYDGKSITMLNRAQKFYGTIEAPASIDEALDTATERFGITLPLEDLMVSDPYHSAISKVIAGRDFGPIKVLGVPCQHLAFTQGAVDWQIWIETGAKPVPKKIVITYKDEEGSPQYTAIFSNWDFETKLPDFLFKFEAPPGAMPIKVAEIKSENQAHEKEGK